MEIVTGVGEKAHVTSKKFRGILEGIIKDGSYILNTGDQLSVELVSNNLLKIYSGEMIHHGNVSSVDPYDEIEISNGTQDMQRIDLIVSRYTKDANTGIETTDWVCIQGTPAESNPQVPDYTVGNLQDGDLVDDCPFATVTLDGINVTSIDVLLKVVPTIPELESELDELNSELENVEATLDATNNTVSGLKNTFSRFTTVGSSGYIKMPNGLNMCYGYCLANTLTADSVSGGYATTITLPITLRSPLVVMVTPVFVSGFPRCSAYAISTSKIKLMCDINVSGCALHWIAIG